MGRKSCQHPFLAISRLNKALVVGPLVEELFFAASLSMNLCRVRGVLPADDAGQLEGGPQGGHHAGHQAQAGGYPGTSSSQQHSCFSNSLCPLCSVPVHGRNVVSHHLSLRLNLSNLSLLSGQFVLVVFWSSRNKSAHKLGILHFLACYPPTNFSPNTLSLFVSSVKPYFTTSITIYTITVLLMSRRGNFDI